MPSHLVAPLLALWSASLGFAQEPVAVTGVPVQNGPVPIRRNINELASENGPQWDLYIQSLVVMYEKNASDALSYFQIAGIHGWPYVAWNNTADGSESSDWLGYCPHGEPIFLPWHRTHVVLYEQILVGHAKEIAAKYPEGRRNEYSQAAEQLRVPFWDWASQSTVPEATIPQSVTINTAKGLKQVKNPLSSYTFPREALDGTFGDINTVRPETPQRPQTYRCAAPESYPETANQQLSSVGGQAGALDLKTRVYDVFVNSQSYAQFASTSDRGSSLEQIHNDVHAVAACDGDFLLPPVSSYEPLLRVPPVLVARSQKPGLTSTISWLHHAGVDRLWAYWQAIHPDEANLAQSYSGGARFTTPQGTNIGPDSPLQPFYRPDGEPHTSKTVASIRDFGYSYEGLVSNKPDKERRDEATRLINRLYSGRTSPAPPTTGGNPRGPGPSNDPSSIHPRPPGGPSSPRPGNNAAYPALPPWRNNSDANSGQEGHYMNKRHYIQIQLDVEQVERPCFVNIYVGNVHAGRMTVMTQPAKGLVNDAIFLNPAIEKFDSQQCNTRRSFSDNIHIDITKRDGTRIELKSAAGMKVEVNKVIVTAPATDNKLPTVEEKELKPVNGGRPLTAPPASTQPQADKPGRPCRPAQPGLAVDDSDESSQAASNKATRKGHIGCGEAFSWSEEAM